MVHADGAFQGYFTHIESFGRQGIFRGKRISCYEIKVLSVYKQGARIMIAELDYPINGHISKIIIIGTAHVSQSSINEVVETIQTRSPDVVAIEADAKRYDLEKEEFIICSDSLLSLLLKRKFFYIFGYSLSIFERELSLLIKSPLGGEMEAAVKESKRIGAEVILIDQDIETTMKAAWDEMSTFVKLKEMSTFFGIAALFRFLRVCKLDLKMDFDKIIAHVNANPDNFKTSMNKSLIEDRNKVLAENIVKATKNKTIVAVLGGYHVPGVIKLIKESNPATVEIEPPKVDKEEIPDYNHSCRVCGNGYNTEYKGIVNRNVVKCECGELYYHLCVNLFIIKFSVEIKPNTENDIKLLKIMFRGKCVD
jgi:hypothetical protein